MYSSFRAPLILAVFWFALSSSPLSAAPPSSNVLVDCTRGDTIVRALDRNKNVSPLLIVVRGTCTENVVLTRDDLTLQGEPGAGVVAAAAAQPTILLDGAKRIALTSLAVSGGEDGVRATRNSSVVLEACTLQNNSRIGIAASFSSSAFVNNCELRNNALAGGVASNSGQLVVTNSNVHDNATYGLIASRNSHLRVGQDANGSNVARPVTISNHGQNGILNADASVAIVVATTVENSGSNGITTTGSSSISIGVGSLGLVAPVTVRNSGTSGSGSGVSIYQGSRGLIQGSVIENNASSGVYIEGSSATVITSTVRNNGSSGVSVINGASARIGLTDSSQDGGNLIENNVLEGVLVVGSSSARLYGNLIQGNSTTNGRFGVLATNNSVVRLIGLNTIQNNGSIVVGATGGGIFLRGSSLAMYKGDFGITPNTNQVINNTGDGIFAVDNSVITLRDGVFIGGNSNFGAHLAHGARMVTRDTTISGNGIGFGGILLEFGSTARLSLSPAPNNAPTDPIICADAESSVTGIVPLPPTCTGF